MFDYNTCRGKVYTISGSRPKGLYALKPEIKPTKGSAFIVRSVTLGGQQIVQPVATMDYKFVMYVYGESWSDITLSGAMLLGDAQTASQSINTLIDYYDSNKVTPDHKKPVSISAGSSGIDAYLVGMKLGAVNPDTNIQEVAFFFKKAPKKP